MILVLGLGNPGRKYERTRHNFGVRILHSLAKGLQVELKQKRCRSQLGRSRIGKKSVIFARPLTFMNNSGEAVAALVRYFKISLSDVIVLYDDIDLPLGKIRIRRKGTSGGHRGLESIIQELGSNEFPRLRIGIGRPPGGIDPRDYVLRNFTRSENVIVKEVTAQATEAVVSFLENGITRTMNKYNA
jgi:PTH1 family peptidyl-tRNA hydrolase